MENSEFEKLSRSLDSTQRQELLSKINGKPQDKSGNDNLVYNESLINSHQRAQVEMAQKEYKMLSFFEKLSILISSLFSGQAKEDILIQRKLNKIKRRIQDINPTLTNFEKKQLTNQFANHIISLFKPINDMQDILTTYFENEDYFYKFLKYECEKNFTDKQKMSYNDCLPQSLQIDTSGVLDTFSYTKEKDRRINKFLSSIDTDNLASFLDDLGCYEKLLRVINYDYKDILLDFSINSLNNPTNVKNITHFKNVSAKLEQLNTLLSSCDFGNSSIIFLSDLADFAKKNPVNQAMGVLKVELTPQDIQRFYMILENIEHFMNKVPLTLIIQYFKKDYLYEPRKVNIKTDFLDKYRANMKQYFSKMWDDFLLDLKRKNLNQLIEGIYPDFKFDVLNHFNPDLYKQIDSVFNYKLTGVYHLNLILYFINKVYKTGLEAVVNKILIDGDFTNDQHKFHLSGVYHSFNNNIAKIKDFDAQFGPQEDMIKRINFYIDKAANSDQGNNKSAEQLLNEIDSKSMSIVRDLINAITNLQTFFNSLMTLQSRGERQIKNLEMINIGAQNNVLYVEKVNSILSNFFKIYRYIDTVY